MRSFYISYFEWRGGGERMTLNIIHTKSEYYFSGDRLILKNLSGKIFSVKARIYIRRLKNYTSV